MVKTAGLDGPGQVLCHQAAGEAGGPEQDDVVPRRGLHGAATLPGRGIVPQRASPGPRCGLVAEAREDAEGDRERDAAALDEASRLA